MPRYVVTTRRANRENFISAKEAVTGLPEVEVVTSSDPDMVTIEASEGTASQLQAKLKGTHFVEPEIHRGLG